MILLYFFAPLFLPIHHPSSYVFTHQQQVSHVQMTDRRVSAYSYSDINDIQCMGSSAVSDVHFGHFSYSLHQGIDSATTLYYQIL